MRAEQNIAFCLHSILLYIMSFCELDKDSKCNGKNCVLKEKNSIPVFHWANPNDKI